MFSAKRDSLHHSHEERNAALTRRCDGKKKSRGAVCALELLFRILLLLLFTRWVDAGAGSSNGEIAVTSLEGRVVDSRLVLDADVEYRFSEAAIDALQNGVPLTFDHRVELRAQDSWWWQPAVKSWKFGFRIRYHTLGAQYQVENLRTRQKEGFATFEAAIKELGTLSALPLMEMAKLPKDKKLELRMRVTLDHDALPLPLRPVAYISSAWDLESEWKRCPLPR